MRMIQPINALTPRADFRGSNGTYRNQLRASTSSKVALVNAGGVAAAAGGIALLFVAEGLHTLLLTDLVGIEVVVVALLGHEFVVGAALFDAVLSEDEDPLGVADRG